MLPSNIAEIRTTEEGIHLLYQSSALQPFKFDNGIVKKIDKYMNQKDESGQLSNPLCMGYNFFANIAQSMNADFSVDQLP